MINNDFEQIKLYGNEAIEFIESGNAIECNKVLEKRQILLEKVLKDVESSDDEFIKSKFIELLDLIKKQDSFSLENVKNLKNFQKTKLSPNAKNAKAISKYIMNAN